jgi:hypothetical protein
MATVILTPRRFTLVGMFRLISLLVFVCGMERVLIRVGLLLIMMVC